MMATMLTKCDRDERSVCLILFLFCKMIFFWFLNIYLQCSVKSSPVKLTGRLNSKVLAPILNSWVKNSDRPSLVQVLTPPAPSEG